MLQNFSPSWTTGSLKPVQSLPCSWASSAGGFLCGVWAVAKKISIYILVLAIIFAPVVRPKESDAAAGVLPFICHPLGWGVLLVGAAYCFVQYKANGGGTKTYKYEYPDVTEKQMIENYMEKNNIKPEPVVSEAGSFLQNPDNPYVAHPDSMLDSDLGDGDYIWDGDEYRKITSDPYRISYYKSNYDKPNWYVGKLLYFTNYIYICDRADNVHTDFYNFRFMRIDTTQDGSRVGEDHPLVNADGVSLESMAPVDGPAAGEMLKMLAPMTPVITPMAELPNIDPKMVETVNVSAMDSAGNFIDDRGRKIPPPPGLTTEPGFNTLPVINGSSASDISAKTGTGEDILLPPDLADALAGVGVPAGSVITGVNGGAATWVDSAGNVGVTAIPSDLAQGLDVAGVNNPAMADSAPPTTGTGEGVETDVGEWTDPSDPSDGGEGSDFDWTGLVLPSFNSTINIPEKEPIPVDSWWDSLPVVGIFSDHTITLDGASSEMSFDLAFFDQTRTVYFDFADWEHIFIVMGQIILGIATYRAILLALTRRLDI